MAFLDNSGDIILDAVLTDTGRFRMARGDFRISKFALGDDEIDYSLYNKNHPSGSAYYDLEVLRTPVMEAFTNNTSTMKSKLLTITRTNILHMPVLKLLDGGNTDQPNRDDFVKRSATNSGTGATGGYIITTTEPTSNLVTAVAAGYAEKGVVLGHLDPLNQAGPQNASIIIERGLDTTKISPAIQMPASLQETQFIVELDHRLGRLTDADGTEVPVSFIDDDQIASYYLSQNTVGAGNNPIVGPPLDNNTIAGDGVNNNTISSHQIRGPRDRVVNFNIAPSINLRTSTFLFDRLGTSTNTATASTMGGVFGAGAETLLVIDSIVRVTSATTSYAIDIPIRFVRKQ
jgi:hypothetical protein